MSHKIVDGNCTLLEKAGRAHCKWCLAHPEFLRGDQACPNPPGIGDVVEKVVKPVAKAMRLPCLDPSGKLRPESKCAKRKKGLNQLGQKVKDAIKGLTGG